LKQYELFITEETEYKKQIKQLKAKLEALVLKKYAKLTEKEIKNIVINKKWLAVIGNSVSELVSKLSSNLAGAVKQTADRYKYTLSNIESDIAMLEKRVAKHLKKMGF
jgi:type I restriction enzyme M protein